LAIHEDAAVGLTLKATTITGAFDAAGTFIPSPAGTAEVDGEEDVVAALRVLERGQVTAFVPFIQTWRKTPSLSEVGGGIGDVNLGGRYDFYSAGQSLTWPGVAVLFGLTVPTGIPPENAHTPLGTGATGIGAFQLTGGLGFEQSFGPWLANLTALLSQRLPRHVGSIDETLGLQLSALAGVGYAFESGSSVALGLGFTGERDAVVNGARVPASGRSVSMVSLSGMLPLAEQWRLQGSFFVDVTVNGFGRNQPAGPGITFTVLRTWS
jgi:hypothetical protein